MVTTDFASVLAQAQWSAESVSLTELVKLPEYQLPALVRVVRGQYLDLVGKDSSAGGAAGTGGSVAACTLLLSSAGKRRHLVAQSVKFKEQRRLLTGQKLLVPDSYDGLFEILSESGKCVRAIESVAELVRRSPDWCLLRQSCKAYVSQSGCVDSITDRSRTLRKGESLVLVGEVDRSKSSGAATGRFDGNSGGISGGGHGRFLRCLDSSGENVYLPYDLKARFSAIAKGDSISGVHSARNLLNKRLPLNVRLVNDQMSNSSKRNNVVSNSTRSVSDLRLHTVYDDELFIGLPISSNSSCVLIPRCAPIKVLTTKNTEKLKNCDSFIKLCQIAEKKSSEAMHRMNQFSVQLPRPDLLDSRGTSMAPPPISALVGPPAVSKVTRQSSGHPTDEYDEIDQIYDYVRGFAPLPKWIRSSLNKSSPDHSNRPISASVANSSNKPEPPPIETIPSRRNIVPEKTVSVHPEVYVSNIQKPLEKSGFKRSHQSTVVGSKQLIKNDANVSKHFTKNVVPKTKTRLFRQKNFCPLKNFGVYYVSQSYTVQDSTAPSALFNMRYKSLNNLAMDSSNTLNSSASGGKTSGDSGHSSAIKTSLPQKKSKRLIVRPLSMTDLVWSPSMKPMAEDHCCQPDVDADQAFCGGVYGKKKSPGRRLEKVSSAKKLGTLYL